MSQTILNITIYENEQKIIELSSSVKLSTQWVCLPVFICLLDEMTLGEIYSIPTKTLQGITVRSLKQEWNALGSMRLLMPWPHTRSIIQTAFSARRLLCYCKQAVCIVAPNYKLQPLCSCILKSCKGRSLWEKHNVLACSPLHSHLSAFYHRLED